MTKTTITNNINFPIENTSLALGFFDGIHNGHKKVLLDAVNLSKKLGTKSVVVTFKNHPVEIIKGLEPEFITTYEERIELLEKLGIDIVIMADFTKEIANYTSEEYFNKILMKFKPKSISIGYNHTFGLNKSGNVAFLERKSQENNFILSISEPVMNRNEITSSTLIRNLIKNGETDKAIILLGREYSIKNIVIKGMQRGRTIGFPTANIEFPAKKIIPSFGVYSGIIIVDGKKHQSMANVGIRPTFHDLKQPIIEAHIIDFDSDIYGKQVEFCFQKKIRDEIKFNSIDILKEQIKKDMKFII